MRDLDPTLPRVELTAYRWADDGFELCITLPLGEPVPREQVRNRPVQSVLKLAQCGLLGKQRGVLQRVRQAQTCPAQALKYAWHLSLHGTALRHCRDYAVQVLA